MVVAQWLVAPFNAASCQTQSMVLPVGVVVRPLAHHRDARGSLVEAFRASNNGLLLNQLNVVVSQPGALRVARLFHRTREPG
jgi:dTDP-4-dehydrorhamnose 3,5-epimerase-like enzyme